MKLSQRQLAKAASVSPATVNADIKAKADVSTIETYLAWRRKHRASRSSRRRKTPALAKPRAKSKASCPVDLGNSWQERIGRAREMEKAGYLAYLDAVENRDVGQLERLQAAHVRSIAALADLEERAAKAELGVTVIRYDHAVQAVVALLRPLRERLLKLPVMLRTDCNAERPQVAELALSEWVARTLEFCNRAENPFDLKGQISAPITSENG